MPAAAWLMNLDFAGGAAVTPVMAGPFVVVAAQVYSPGAVAAEVYRPGQAAAEVFLPGAIAAEVEPE